MDTKDPVWDDDEFDSTEGGFGRRNEPTSTHSGMPSKTEASPEPEISDADPVENQGAEHVEAEQSPIALELEESSSPAGEHSTEGGHLVEIPPPSERFRLESVSGIETPMPGGGRRGRNESREKDRSTTALVIVALLLFVVSVISVSVYFFSRPAEPGTEESIVAPTTNTAPIEDAVEAESSSGEEAGMPQTDTAMDAAESAAPDVPPPPAPASAASRSPAARAAVTSGVVPKEPKSSSESLAEKRAPVKESLVDRVPPPAAVAPKDQARQTSKAQTTDDAPLLNTSKSSNATGSQWVVQVHSSQSIDDASEWLQQLQSRNIGDGRIEPVTQRGTVWYRVRFGRYATRLEAERAALDLGYRNAWIDRIR